MSRERAQRRAARQAEADAVRAARQRRTRRREARRALARRLRPRLPDRRTGRLFARRSSGERAVIAVGALVALVLVWLGLGDLSTRIAGTVLVLIAIPAVTILLFDRRI